MSEVLYPTEFSIRGPWLIDQDQLLALDTLIEEEWNRLTQRRQQLIADYQEESNSDRVPYNLDPESKDVVIIFKSGATLKTSSFKDSLRDPSTSEEIPVGFKVELSSAEIRLKLSSSLWDDGLKLNVSPSDIREARELLVTIKQWMKDNAAPLWQRIWSQIAGIHWMGFFLFIYVAGTFFSTSPAERETKNLARQLLEDGISSSNIDEAIQYLLALELDYYPGISAAEPAPWFPFVFWSLLALSIIASFKPKVLLGIGKGKVIVQRWKWWLRFIGVSIPTFLVGSVLVPMLIDFIREHF